MSEIVSMIMTGIELKPIFCWKVGVLDLPIQMMNYYPAYGWSRPDLRRILTLRKVPEK